MKGLVSQEEIIRGRINKESKQKILDRIKERITREGKIIVILDNEFNCKRLSKILDVLGYNVSREDLHGRSKTTYRLRINAYQEAA